MEIITNLLKWKMKMNKKLSHLNAFWKHLSCLQTEKKGKEEKDAIV